MNAQKKGLGEDCDEIAILSAAADNAKALS